jgi:hypothetical protein
MKPERPTPWFAPKRFGYGAGLPIAWQGWALLAAYLGAILLAAKLLQPLHPALMVTVVTVIALAPMPLIARRTRGGWKWRNGRELD